MKRVLFITGLILAATLSFGQQRAMFSQYMLNQYSINPAVAGSTPYSPICLSYKQFWTGIDDAPGVQALNGHFGVGDNMGVGGQIYNYKTGPTSRQGIEGTYAYHLKVTETAKLSLALTGMLYQNQINKSELVLEEQDDDAIMFSSNRLIVPDAAFGAYFYDKNYYAGIAVPNLFNRKVDFLNENILEQRQVRHYFLHGGYIFETGDFKVEPSVLLRFIEAGVFQADVNVKGTYNDMFTLGASYRLGDGMAIMAGVGNQKVTFGYCYDLALTAIKNASNGSHELMFIYKIGGSSPAMYSE